MGFPCTPLVSLQRLGRGTAVDRHECWGVLVGPDAVVVPLSGPDLDDGSGWFEVLLASPVGRGEVAIERIPVERADVTRVVGRPDALATLTLARASRHLPFAGDYDPAGLAEVVDEGTTLWEGLEKIGFVPTGLLDRPVDALDVVVAAEEERRRQRVTVREVRSVRAAGSIWCCNWFTHKCCRTCKTAAWSADLPFADAGTGPLAP